MNKFWFLVCLCSVFAFNIKVNAQVFGGEIPEDSYSNFQQNTGEISNEQTDDVVAEDVSNEISTQNIEVPTVAMPQNQPLLKEKFNKNIKQIRYTDNGEQEVDEAGIYLYYTDFKVDRYSFGGGVYCDIKFVLFTNLTESLSNIAFKVKWPDIQAGLTFSNVEPGQRYYYEYRFDGEGCYSMDKAPNIIINRCRLKGYSQKDCAGLFSLLYVKN